MTVMHYPSRYETFLVFIFMELLKVFFGFGKTLKLNTTIKTTLIYLNFFSPINALLTVFENVFIQSN